MSTVGALVDRLFRTYLEPPDLQPATSFLSTPMTDVATSLVFGAFVVPEDELLLKVGAVAEVEAELMLVTNYDPFTTTATVSRAMFGTSEAAHVAGSLVKLSPPFARTSVFEAVADNIITLYPDLYTVQTTAGSGVGNVVPMDDPLAVEVISVWSGLGSEDVGGTLVDFHPAAGGRAVLLERPMGDVWIKYRRRFGAALSESDTLESLGVHARWENLVMLGAAADLFVGRDLPASHTQWVGASLEAANVPVGTRTSIASALSRYRDIMLERARKEMRAEYGSRIRQRPTQIVDLGAW